MPINQADMLGTLLEFSLLMMDGAQRLGFLVTPTERKAILGLWRYCGYLTGVDPWLLDHLATEEKTRRIAELIRMVQPGPDEDSLLLTRQLLKVPKQNARGAGPGGARRCGQSLSQRPRARAQRPGDLRQPRNPGRPLEVLRVPGPSSAHAPLERVRRRVPFASRLVAHASNTIIRKDLERILGGREPSFG